MAECTIIENVRSRLGKHHFYCLTRGQAIGLAIRVSSGFVSLIAVLIAFVYICWKVYRHARRPHGAWRVLNSPARIYMFALFVFDFLQSFGRTLDIKWVQEGKVYTGAHCNAAGSIQQVGETGSAQITIALAIHVFISGLYEIGIEAGWVAWAAVVAACIYTSLFVGIGHLVNKGTTHPYNSPTPYWCWIGPEKELLAERITGQYMWLWMALIISLILYIPMFFFTRGNITLDPGRWWRLRIHHAPPGHVNGSVGMLAYPLVYAGTILPLSIVRWYGFSNPVPSAALFAVSSLYGLNGLFNVLLLLTRPAVLRFRALNHHGLPDDDDDEDEIPLGPAMAQEMNTPTGQQGQQGGGPAGASGVNV